jgi:WD40 repeat protein
VAHVFISYSRKDKNFVRQLNDALIAQKREAWVDWKDIPLTAEWQREIFDNIERADNFVFVISPDSVISVNCNREIEHAFANHKKILPIFYRSVQDVAIPESLGKLQRIEFSDSDHFDEKFATLITALDTDFEWVQAHTRLLTRAKEWERQGKERSFLLRGKDLSEAEQMVAKAADREPKPTAQQSEYILASRQSAIHTQRIIIGAVAVAFLIAMSLAIYAFLKRNEAQRQATIALARQLAAQSELLSAQAAMPTNIARIQFESTESHWATLLERSILLAIESLKRMNSLEGDAALRRALDQAPRLIRHFPNLKTKTVALSADGSRLASAGPDAVEIFDISSGKSLAQISVQGVEYIVFPPAKDWVALWSDDKWILYNIATQRKYSRRGTRDPLAGFAFSLDGRYAVIAMQEYDEQSSDVKATSPEVVDLDTGNILRKLPAPDTEATLAFSSNGATLVSVGTQYIRVWNTKSWTQVKHFAHQVREPLASALSPDGSRVAIAFRNHATVFNVQTGKAVMTNITIPPFDDEYEYFIGLAFSQDGRQIASIGDHRTAQTWSLESGELINVMGESYNGAWFPPGYLLVKQEPGYELWDVTTAKEASRLLNAQEVETLAVSRDADRVALAGDFGIKVFDTSGSHHLARLVWHGFPRDNSIFPSTHHVAIQTADGIRVWNWPACDHSVDLPVKDTMDVSSSPDTKHLMIRSATTLALWNIPEARIIMSFPDPQAVAAFDFSDDGQQIAVSFKDGSIHLFDVLGNRSVRQTNLGVVADKLIFAPDASSLAVKEKNRFLIISVPTLKKVADHALNGLTEVKYSSPSVVLAVTENEIWNVDSGSGSIQRLADESTAARLRLALQLRYNISTTGRPTRSSNPLLIHDRITGQNEVIPWIHEDSSEIHLISSDGRYLLAAVTTHVAGGAGPDRTPVFVYDLKKHQPVGKWAHANGVNDARFSPDGEFAITASGDGTIHVFRLQSRESFILRHEDAVNEIDISADSRYLASASDDRTLRLWDLPTGREITRVMHSGKVHDVYLNSKAGRVSTISWSSTEIAASVFPISHDELLKIACSELSRASLTESEWRDYFANEAPKQTCP